MDGVLTKPPDLRSEATSAPTNTPLFIGDYSKVVVGILGVMKRIKDVRKEGYNKEGKYGFVANSDLTPLLQDALVAEKITIGQREVSRAVISKILFIGYQFDIWHQDGGIIFNIGSHTGACRFEFKSGSTDDKSANKCFVAAAKYFALQQFKIAPDDNNADRVDADADGIEDEPARGNSREVEQERSPLPPYIAESRRDGPIDYGPPPEPPPYDGPPDDYVAVNDRPPLDDEPVPFGTGPVSPPPSSPTEAGFRERIMTFKKFIIEIAQSEDEAHDHWRANADLLRQCADTTYDFLRVSYEKRWGIYPPAV